MAGGRLFLSLNVVLCRGFKKTYMNYFIFFVIKNLGLASDPDYVRIHQQPGSDPDLAKCQDLDGRIQ